MEQIELFTNQDISTLESNVNEWLKQNSDVVVIDRKFATCTMPDSDYSAIMRVQFSYCIVYREPNK